MPTGIVAGLELEGGWPLALARACADAALLSSFGSLVFGALRIGRSVPAIPAWSLRAALLLLPAWLALQAASFTDDFAGLPVAETLGDVALRTRFGQIVVAQEALCAASLLLFRTDRREAAAPCAGVAVACIAAHGHGLAMQGWLGTLFLCGILHALCAGVWLGGLPPLLATIRGWPPRQAARALRRFSPLAAVAVSGLAVTAIYQGMEMSGSAAGLVGTAYGLTLLIKASLFAGLLLIAFRHRFRLTPALDRNAEHCASARVRRSLLASLTTQACLGAGVILAAAVLGGLEPAMHLQPIWPFAVRPSLAPMREDGDIAREVILACVLLAGAPSLVAWAVWKRRGRVPALAGAAALLWFALPHAAPLFVPAEPTIFYASPTGVSAESVRLGAAIFADHCAGCHGAGGFGNGPAAAGLAVPPADLMAPHLWDHPDGQLFWWIGHGMEAPDGAQSMPGFGALLSSGEIWAAIDFIHARNAGLPANVADLADATLERMIHSLGVRDRNRMPAMHHSHPT